MDRKQFAVAVLFSTVLLTAVIVPMSTQQGGGTYDPWLDYNGDGKIDVNDLHPLGESYGTMGDSTRDVNVTNWPTETVLFPENLMLRATRYSVTRGTFEAAGSVTKYELIDSTTLPPSPNVAIAYEYVSQTIGTIDVQLYNGTFVYYKIPTEAYRILGHPAVLVTFNVTTSAPSVITSLKAHAFLGKISVSGEWTELAYLGLRVAGVSGQVNNLQTKLTMTHIDPVDLTMNAGEKLAIRLLVYGHAVSDSTNLQLKILHGAETDYFLVDIPIIKNT